MHLTLNKQSALRILRIVRARNGKRGLPSGRTSLSAPDPTPRSRWNARLFENALAGIDAGALGHGRLEACVPSDCSRLGSRLVANTVYCDTIPANSFVVINENISIACPELMFTELGAVMTPAEHLLLGYEICGTYSRDADDPVEGEAVFGVPAVTSVARIRAYLDATGRIEGKTSTRRTLGLLADGAWSPMEAAIATVASLPLEENGYGLGRCKLNERVEPTALMRESAKRASRVPDILFGDTRVGINYDGEYHLDLDMLIDAALRFARNPGSRQAERELEDAKRRVRAQVIDDNRRNRELVSGGYIVFPVFKEDLYDEGGFDATMMQVLEALRLYERWKDDGRMELIGAHAARAERRELLTSLIPGRTREIEGTASEAIVSLKYRNRGKAF